MTAAAVASPAARPAAAALARLRANQPELTAFGLAALLAAAVLFALPLVDARTLNGALVWLKPAKFFLSTGVFALTSAAFFGLVRPERRDALALRASVWAAMGLASLELAYITLQAARGQASHYNTSGPVEIALYAAMGIAAVALLATKIPLAWEIFRRPAPGVDPTLRLAAVLGMALTVVLGGAAGLYMGGQPGHAVGPDAGGLPLFGWNCAGGDLRAAHFLGMHAEQVLPAVALMAAWFGARRSTALVALAGAALAAATLFALAQAIAGRPFPLG